MNAAESSKTSISFKLFKNTSYNMLTQGVLIIIAMWAIPLLVHRLGNESFGLLALLWALVGYFSLLDLGISRANTKYLSEEAVRGAHTVASKIVWTSLTVSTILGLLAMLILFAITPLLLLHVFKIAPEQYPQISSAFRYAALSLPWMLAFGSLKGVQMAFLRFDLVNIFQGGMSLIQWVGSVFLAYFGFGLKEIMLLTLVLRIISVIIVFIMMPSLIPSFFQNIQLWDKAIYQKLIHFGGWVTISQIISPLFLYFDRIFIAALLNLTAVAYYTVPQEAIGRLLVIPVSLSIVLFPVFSGQSISQENREQVKELYIRSIKYLFFIGLPIMSFLFIYASPILQLWVGSEYAKESSLVFQIIAVGFLFNSLAQVPTAVLHAYGRPDLTAKFHMGELVLMLILNVIMIPWLGIIGAAITWSLRVILDALLLFAFCRTIVGWSRTPAKKFFGVWFEIVFILIFVLSLIYIENFILKLIIYTAALFLYVFWLWSRGFDEIDKKLFLQLRSKFSL